MLTGIFQGLLEEFIMIFDLSEMSCVLTFGIFCEPKLVLVRTIEVVQT